MEEKAAPFHVTVLGIICDTKNRVMLIGRRENDPNVRELTWCLPGGDMREGDSPEDALKREAKEKTGLDIDVFEIVLAKVPEERKDSILLYYQCEVLGGEEKAGGSFKELKWIKPTDIKKYSTTSLDFRLMRYLERLMEFWKMQR